MDDELKKIEKKILLAKMKEKKICDGNIRIHIDEIGIDDEKKHNLSKKETDSEICSSIISISNMEDSNSSIIMTSDSDNSNKKDKISKLLNVLLSNNLVHIECTNVRFSNKYTHSMDNYIEYKNINILNCKFPMVSKNNITDNNNILKIMYRDVTYQLLINQDYYNRYELTMYINDLFKENNFDILCKINEYDSIIFESCEEFSLLDCNHSVLITLGFANGSYCDVNTIKSDYPIQLNDNIYYMAIIGISCLPIFRINMDTCENDKLVDICPGRLKNLEISFFKTPKHSLDLSKQEYFKNEHSFDILFI